MAVKISFVIPLLNEQDSLKELYAAIMDVVNANGYGYEMLFVDDGSTDNSLAILQELAEQDENVQIIQFRRNFGKATALQTGFRHVTGDVVITMDADLQDDPKEIPRFLEKLDEGYDMVSGWKQNRHDPAEKRLPSKLFNKFTSTVSGVKLHDFNCGFKAYKKEVVDSIDLYGELHRYIPVLADKKGFRITEIVVEHHARKHGVSKYGVSRYIRGLFDSLSTTFLSRYSDKPMYFFGKMGLYFLAIGLILGIYLSIQWVNGSSIGGRPLLILCMMLVVMGGLLFAIGFLGDMMVAALYRTRYDESHVKRIISKKEKQD